jgi:hypothetical protein
VGDAAGELTEGLHLLGLSELRFERAVLLLHAPARMIDQAFTRVRAELAAAGP